MKNNEKKTQEKHHVLRIFVYLYMIKTFIISHMGFYIKYGLFE